MPQSYLKNQRQDIIDIRNIPRSKNFHQPKLSQDTLAYIPQSEEIDQWHQCI